MSLYQTTGGLTLGGMRVVSDPNALEGTAERLFPESRHRSQRIKKKLIKRLGGEFRRVPAVFKIGSNLIVAHPVRYAEINRMLKDSQAYGTRTL